MIYQPVGTRIIIKPNIIENKTISGLLIKNDSKFIEGVVIYMSKSIKDPEYNIWDHVQYNKLKSEEVVINNEIFHLMDYEAVTAKITITHE